MRSLGLRALPLRRQLFIAIALLLCPVLAAVAWSGFSTLRERAFDTREQARVVAITTAAFIDSDLANLDRMAAGLAQSRSLLTPDREQIRTFLRNVASGRPLLIDIAVVAADGTTIARAKDSVVMASSHVEDTAMVVRTGQRVVKPAVPAGGDARHICFGYPIPGWEGGAALWFTVSLDAMQHAVSTLPLPEGSVVTVTDGSGRVLMRSLDPARYVGRTLQVSERMPDETDWADHVGADGVRRIYVRRAINHGPWNLTVGIPFSVAFMKAGDIWRRGLVILGVWLVGWMLVAVTMSKRLSSSVQHLNDAAKRIAAGDFNAIEQKRMPSRELADLQSAFGQMLHRFNDTRAELDRHLGEERRIRQELQSLQRQVIRQERLAAVGQLVSGVAHEINNPLQAILGFAELLQMQGDVPDSVKPDLRLIQKESARACTIIRNLALFARQQPAPAGPVRLTDVVNAVVELRQRRLESENIDLVVSGRAERPVLALLPELQQVTLNFVGNAEQAIKMSGRLPGRISIRTYETDGYIGLEVEDTGPGISPENEAKLFQPFFTTKPVGMGTGLGLSVSYGIIDSLGGRIGFRNAPAGGAIFYFELPAAAGDTE